MTNFFKNPYLLLILTALFWSGNMVVVRALNTIFPENTAIPPISLGLGRWLIVLILTAPFAWEYRLQIRELKNHINILLVLSITGICAFNTFAYIALKSTSATNAALLNSFIPIVTMILGIIFLKQHITLLQTIGVLISMIGVAIIVIQGDFGNLIKLNINQGDLWMLLAVIDWAIYTLALRWHPKIHPLLLLFVLTIIGIFFLLPLSIYELWQSNVSSYSVYFSQPNMWTVLYIGIFPGFLGYVFYNYGIRMVGAYCGSLFIHLMPVFGSLLAWSALGEQLYTYHFFGMVSIFSGIILAVYIRK